MEGTSSGSSRPPARRAIRALPAVRSDNSVGQAMNRLTLLKSHAGAVERALAGHLPVPELPPSLRVVSSVVSFPDATEDMIAANKNYLDSTAVQFFPNSRGHPHYVADCLAGKFSIPERAAQALYIEIVNGIYVKRAPGETKEELVLSIGNEEFPGGWNGKGYGTVHVNADFNPLLQRASVFPFGGTNSTNLDKICAASTPMRELLTSIKAGMCTTGSPWKPEDLEACQAHALFGYARESHFAFHKDTNSFKKFTPDVAAICHLSSGKASMYVAGAQKELEYTGAGSVVFIDTEIFHRTGLTEHGTVRIAFFFKDKLKARLKKEWEKRGKKGPNTQVPETVIDLEPEEKKPNEALVPEVWNMNKKEFTWSEEVQNDTEDAHYKEDKREKAEKRKREEEEELTVKQEPKEQEEETVVPEVENTNKKEFTSSEEVLTDTEDERYKEEMRKKAEGKRKIELTVKQEPKKQEETVVPDVRGAENMNKHTEVSSDEEESYSLRERLEQIRKMKEITTNDEVPTTNDGVIDHGENDGGGPYGHELGTTALGEGKVNMVPQDDVAQEANEDKNVTVPVPIPMSDLSKHSFFDVSDNEALSADDA